MNTKQLVRILLATIAGEISLVLFTTIAQEVIVDGVHFATSSTMDLILGGFATLVAGALAGMVASTLGGKDNKWPHVIISLFIITETIYLMASGKTGNPIWFSTVSSVALILSVWGGFYAYRQIKK